MFGVSGLLMVMCVGLLILGLERESKKNEAERVEITEQKAVCLTKCAETYEGEVPRATCEQTCSADANAALERVSIWD